MKTNVVFTDFEISEQWTFLNELNKNEQWTNINCINNGKTNTLFKKIKKFLTYITFSFKNFLKRTNFSKIIAWQQYYGLFFAFFCNFFRVKKNFELVIMTFIYKKKEGFISNFKYKFINSIITSNYVDSLVCFTQNEVHYYSRIFPAAKNKFKFVTLGVEDITHGVKTSTGDYYISAGNSNRDYDFLLSEFSNVNRKLKIICYNSPKSRSDNIEILRNTFGKDYYKEIANCKAVIVSLDDPNISSGQLVFIHAMQFGKPIICTSSNAISDYVIDGYNGYVINKNLKELSDAIDKVENNYLELSANSYDFYKKRFTMEIMANNIYKLFVSR